MNSLRNFWALKMLFWFSVVSSHFNFFINMLGLCWKYLKRELAPNLKYITTIKWLVSQFVGNSWNLWNLSRGREAWFYLEAVTSLLVNVVTDAKDLIFLGNCMMSRAEWLSVSCKALHMQSLKQLAFFTLLPCIWVVTRSVTRPLLCQQSGHIFYLCCFSPFPTLCR